MSSPLQLSSASVEHYTPSPIVEAARFTLERIALDPASCARANEVVRAERFFDAEIDGLAQVWEGPVFLNPPGGRAERRYRNVKSNSSAVLWWAKLCDEWQRARGTAACALRNLAAGAPAREWPAIFVGFSLEILQAAQGYAGPQPLDFPTCIPDKRIEFEADAVARQTQLKCEIEGLEARALLGARDELKLRKLRKRLADIGAAVEAGATRVAGEDPTHANVIVCLTTDRYVARRFAASFAPFGYVRGVT